MWSSEPQIVLLAETISTTSYFKLPLFIYRESSNKKLIYWETITENRKIYERYKYYGISLLFTFHFLLHNYYSEI